MNLNSNGSTFPRLNRSGKKNIRSYGKTFLTLRNSSKMFFSGIGSKF